MMRPPPRSIDGATVIRIADLSGVTVTGRTTHLVGGEQAVGFAALAIVRYEPDPGYYLFYCDDCWATVTDTYHDTIEGAVEQARFEFTNVEFVDVSGAAS
jgi:hypothetical protein